MSSAETRASAKTPTSAKTPRSAGAGPTLGALLRLAHHAVNQKLAAWLSESAYADIQPAHCAAVQALWIRPEGASLTAMAQTAHITKQSMAALADDLIRGGYIERARDPDDGRALRLRLTDRGRALATDIRAFATRLEATWARRVGARRVGALRETLALILAADQGDG
jgi:DNA-binding MarR family transcriptional regulator